MARKKQQHEEEGGSERWLVSYADFITLLFAFFTTLYAISTVDAQKMGKMVTSMRASFDNNLFEKGSSSLVLSPGTGGESAENTREILEKVNIKGQSTKDLTMQSLKDMKFPYAEKKEILNGEKALGRFKRNIESLLADEIAKGRVKTSVEPRGLIISLGEAGVFDSGSDEIKPDGRVLLDKVATSLVSVGNQIRIEGHTDNVPIKNTKFPSNWELSTSRATRTNRYLIENFGLRPELISAAGYAEYRPVAGNDTEEGRSRNRRIDIVVLNPSFALSEPR